jgi:hypothetical protein
MKEETNKEIDLLLRRLSGRDGEAVRDAETQMDDRHLDADELSSYAQNVAPPKARARYTQHLAECSTCRRMATELSLALGATAGVTSAAAPVETMSPASGLKRFLSSLLSPMVLRYAGPALGVIVVMMIGFVVLRQRESREALMAGNYPTAAQAPVPNTGPSTPPLADQRQNLQEAQRKEPENSKPSQEPAQAREGAPGEAGAGAAARDESKQTKPSETADTAAAAPAPVPVPTPDVHKFTEKSVSELPLVRATPPTTLSPQANITTDGETAKTKKEEAAKRETPPAAKTAEVQTAGSTEQANEAPRKAAPTPAKSVAAGRVEEDKAASDSRRGAGTGVAGRAATRRRAADAKDDSETRSIAGRKFRKEDGIWTDTAYDGSTRTVNMARSSEQFRALVADEPAIGTIAEQLDGEVIVVWKGRPYRIR